MINHKEEVEKILTVARLRDLQKSGLNYERIYLDGYRNGSYGWEIPMRDPFNCNKELFVRTRLDNPQVDGPKYIQPEKTGLVPFYPHQEDWLQIANDIEVRIIFTEGEKKSSKLTQEGFVTISMPGVNAYGSEKFMTSLESFIWDKRNVYLCFDDDIKIKPQVRKALDTFAMILHRKGAKVLEIQIPEMEAVSSKGDK